MLIDDFIDFTSGRAWTFFDGEIDPGFGRGRAKVTHTDMSSPYYPEVRALLRRAAREASIELIDGGVYCATNGRRFETPADIFVVIEGASDRLYRLVGQALQPSVTGTAE